MKVKDQSKCRVRLSVGGMLVLVLLTWVSLGQGLPPLIVPPGRSVSPWPILLTALLATLTLVILAPVPFLGAGKQRWLSILLSLIPLLLLLLVVLWTAGVISRTS